MTTTLMAVIDGTPVPLTDCSWVQTMACGCICSVATAAYGDVAYATEQQIHEHTAPTKRERARNIKHGFTWELMTFEQYKTRFGVDAWKCPHTYAQRTGKEPVDAPFPANGDHDETCAYVSGMTTRCTCGAQAGEAA